MNKISIAILHRDLEYSRALKTALCLSSSLFSVKIIEDKNLPAEGLVCEYDYGGYNVLLVDHDLKAKLESTIEPDAKTIIGLSETPELADNDGYLYKYGGLNYISSYIKTSYAETTGLNRINFMKGSADLTGFTSGAGGTGTSSIAISTARELALTDRKKTLYLSFEHVDSSPVYMVADDDERTVNEYLYYLFKYEKENVSTFLDAFISTDSHGLSAFRPSIGKNELNELGYNQLLKLIKTLSESKFFNHLIVDFRLDDSVGAKFFMDSCKKIFLIDDGTPISIFKNKKMLDNIFIDGKGGCDERIIRVTNKWVADDESLIHPGSKLVEYDPESFVTRDKKMDISLGRHFGLGIRRIADEFAT